MTPVRLEPAVAQSQVKHSFTEPQRSLQSLAEIADISLSNMQSLFIKFSLALSYL